MRLLERIILQRLRAHLDANNLIIHNQSGFRSLRQTKDNLFHLVQKSTENFHRGNKTLCVFFDIEKAFDKMWHKGLLYKMHRMNFPYYLIRFVENFLKNRTFFVHVDGSNTEKFVIFCGCPQGAVLSPTLFLIFINDIPTKYERNSEYSALFADDLVYYIFYNRLSPAITSKIQNYLNCLESWANLWRLSFAPHKCNFIVLTKYGSSEDRDKIDLRLYGNKLSYEANPKFLGITLDENLSFEKHVETIRASCIGRMNVLKIITYSKWQLQLRTKITVYKSIIRSLVDYCAFLYVLMSKKSQEQLQIVQNDALRIILKKGFNIKTKKHEKIVNLHEAAQILPIADRCEKLRSRYVINSVANCNPLICDAIIEYKGFAGGRILKNKTLFDNLEIFDVQLPNKFGNNFAWNEQD